MKKARSQANGANLPVCRRNANNQKIKAVQIPPVRVSGSADATLAILRRAQQQKKFSLDYAAAQTIKNNFRSLASGLKPVPKTAVETQKPPFSVLSKIRPARQEEGDIVAKYKANPYLRQMITKYHLMFEKLDEILHLFVYLSKVSVVYKSHVKDTVTVIENAQKEEQIIKKLFDVARDDSEDVMDSVNFADYNILTADLYVVKNYHKPLARLPQTILNRMLLAMDINPVKGMQISLDTFIKIRYYLIDFRADTKEFITFGRKFIDPKGKKNVGIDDLMRIFKQALIRDEQDGNGKRELLLKALLTNFVICGVIDSNGKFHPEIFDDTYKKEKMNILSFIKILLS